MKKKNIINLLIIFIILICITVFYEVFIKNKGNANEPFSKFRKYTLNKIEITSLKNKFAFEQINKIWEITSPKSYEADQKAIDDLIDKILKLELGDEISTDPLKHKEFQVQDNSGGTSISVYKKNKENPIISFILGKTAYDYLHNYFRYPDSDTTLVCKGLSHYEVDLDLKYWRNKQIFTIDPLNIIKIDLLYRKNSVTLVKNEDKWNFDDSSGEVANIDSVNTLLDHIENFMADDFKDDMKSDDPKTGFNNSSFQILIQSLQKQEEIIIGTKTDSFNYVKRKGSEQVFLVYSHKIDQLKKTKKDFKLNIE